MSGVFGRNVFAVSESSGTFVNFYHDVIAACLRWRLLRQFRHLDLTEGRRFEILHDTSYYRLRLGRSILVAWTFQSCASPYGV